MLAFVARPLFAHHGAKTGAERYGVADLLTLGERHFRVLPGPGGRPFRILPAEAG